MGSGQCIKRELLRTLKWYEFLVGGDVRIEGDKEVIVLYVSKIREDTDLPSYFQNHRVVTELAPENVVISE